MQHLQQCRRLGPTILELRRREVELERELAKTRLLLQGHIDANDFEDAVRIAVAERVGFPANTASQMTASATQTPDGRVKYEYYMMIPQAVAVTHQCLQDEEALVYGHDPHEEDADEGDEGQLA